MSTIAPSFSLPTRGSVWCLPGVIAAGPSAKQHAICACPSVEAGFLMLRGGVTSSIHIRYPMIFDIEDRGINSIYSIISMGENGG